MKGSRGRAECLSAIVNDLDLVQEKIVWVSEHVLEGINWRVVTKVAERAGCGVSRWTMELAAETKANRRLVEMMSIW